MKGHEGQRPKSGGGRHHSLAAVVLGLMVAAWSAGCAGYELGSVKPEKLQDVESIAIPTIKNMTLEPRTSVLVTNAIIKRFHEDGTYKISTVNKADATLEVTLRQIDRRQLRAALTDQLETTELAFRFVVNYVLRDNRNQDVLEQGVVYGTTDVFLDPNLQLSERQATPHAADEVAGQLVSQLSEGW